MVTQLSDDQIAVWKSAAEDIIYHPATPMAEHCQAYAIYSLADHLQALRVKDRQTEKILEELSRMLKIQAGNYPSLLSSVEQLIKDKAEHLILFDEFRDELKALRDNPRL